MEMLLVADLYRLENLSKMSIIMIARNLSTIVKMEAWREKLAKNNTLMKEIMEFIAKDDLGEPSAKRRRMRANNSDSETEW